MVPLPIVRPPWQACVLVCQKCLKKAKAKKGFFGALRDALRARFGKKAVRVVKSSCLDLCPKGRIVVASAAPGRTLALTVAKPDTPMDDVLATLELG
jgi:predicted metal-binding protein